MQGHHHGLRATRLDAGTVIGPRVRRHDPSAVRKAHPILGRPKPPGTSQAEYMTVQANYVLADGERSIHDGGGGGAFDSAFRAHRNDRAV